MQDYTYLGIYASMVPGFEKNAGPWWKALRGVVGELREGMQGAWTAGRKNVADLKDAKKALKGTPDEIAVGKKTLDEGFQGGALKTMKNQFGAKWNALDPEQRNALTQAGLGAAGIGGFGAGAALL